MSEGEPSASADTGTKNGEAVEATDDVDGWIMLRVDHVGGWGSSLVDMVCFRILRNKRRDWKLRFFHLGSSNICWRGSDASVIVRVTSLMRSKIGS